MKTAQLLVAVSVVVLMPIACSPAPQSREGPAETADTADGVISGTLAYRQRVALPDNASYALELRQGESGPVVATQRESLGGKQVPVPFALTYELSKATGSEPLRLQAAIMVGAEPKWISEPIIVDVAGGEQDVGEVLLTPYKALAFATSYRCGDTLADIGVYAERMTLKVGSETFALQQTATASGAKYEAEGDPTTFFWSKGETGLLSIRGEEYPECAKLPAQGAPAPRTEETAAAPAAFKARGNEPGWSFEIKDGRLTMISAYGEKRLEKEAPAPSTSAGQTTYSLPQENLTVTIFQRLCADDATGMPYPVTVEATWGEENLRGCGGEPSALLRGAEWVVEDITGGIVDRSRATLTFDDDGRVSGRATCNSFNASYTLSGEGLSIGQAASTMMACPPALMDQERRFLDILAGTVRFEIDETGALILHAPDGRRILARR